MYKIADIEASARGVTSPLMLADRILSLAQDADRAGYQTTADRLLSLAFRVLDRPGRASLKRN